MDCVGHSTGSMDMTPQGHAVLRLFPAIYLMLHRRQDPAAWQPTVQMQGTLQHLALAGPLTVSELGRHLGRAQSVASQMVDALENHGVVERVRDARDGRKVLVWLTPAGEAQLDEQRQVLSPQRVAAALKRMTPAHRRALVTGMTALVNAAQQARVQPSQGETP